MSAAAAVNVDELTQLGDRGHFDKRALAEWNRAIREHLPVSILLIEIDDEVAGDDVVRRVIATIRGCCRRSTDLAARFGKESFAVVLPNTPIEGAKAVGQQIRHTVEGVTLSVGCASATPIVGDSLRALIVRAESALASSKYERKNRLAMA